MTKSETARLLTLVAAFDRRTIGEADVEAWHLVLADLEPGDCAEAVRHHFSTSRDWLMPADIRSRAVTESRRREGRARASALAAQLAQENPPQELTDRQRPLLALMAGTPLQPVPRPGWSERKYGKRPIVEKPPFTAEELAVAQAALDEAAAVRGEATSG